MSSSNMPKKENNRVYIAIDLKSFYASVECVERGLDPLTTNLLVADVSRTEKTICLAVSPSLKAYGISGRARLFEAVQRLKEVNALRSSKLGRRDFAGSSYDDVELKSRPDLKVDYIAAVPRMALYLEKSTKVYQVYMKYVAPEDIHVYSIDEVFMDVTGYLSIYGLTPRELAMKIILDVLETTGITATAGIGPNLYLCKIAMDIGAKRVKPDENGVRIAELDEMSYRRLLWEHKPITDFWRVGRGYAKRLTSVGLYTMGDVARCSVGAKNEFYNEDLLYKLFGVNAELLIDHAWGWEPCTMKDIRDYRPATNCLSSGQVLQDPYTADKARLVTREMAEAVALDLVSKGLVTNQLTVTVGYDRESLERPEIAEGYKGEVTVDVYGRRIPKHAHGTANFDMHTSSTKEIVAGATEVFDRTVNKSLLVRRITIGVNNILREERAKAQAEDCRQLDFLSMLGEDDAKAGSPGAGAMVRVGSESADADDFCGVRSEDCAHDEANEVSKRGGGEKDEAQEERKMQETLLAIKEKFGKNAVVKGMSLEEGATGMQRNKQIGGHKA